MEINKPLVSVLMPSYNREKYIEEAVQSVLSSTFQNYELLIVDDCSTDRTFEIAKTFENVDARVKVIRNERNIGQFQNRNYIISLANGKYIKFLDSDDIIYTDSLITMVKALESFPTAGFAIQYELPKGPKQFPFLITSPDAYRLHFLGGGLLFPGPSAVIYRRAVLNKFKFENTYGSLGDTYLLLQIAAHYSVVALPPNLIFWRVHNEQISEEQRTSTNVMWQRYLMNKTILLSQYVPIDQREAAKILARYRRILCRNILRYSIYHIDFSQLTTCKKQAALTWLDFLDAMIPNRLLNR